MTYKVILFDFNKKKVEWYDIIPYLTQRWLEMRKRGTKVFTSNNEMPKTFEDFKLFILKASQYQFWSRCEYEVLISSWPPYTPKLDKDTYTNKEVEEILKKDIHIKVDAYQQIATNIDTITMVFMKHISQFKAN